jgi:hypothetical protein
LKLPPAIPLDGLDTLETTRPAGEPFGPQAAQLFMLEKL